MDTLIVRYKDSAEEFKKLTLEEQLALVADIKLYWDERETDAIEEGDKIAAKRAKDRAKYWLALNQNLKKIAELEIVNRRMA